MTAEQNKALIGKAFDELINHRNYSVLNSVLSPDFMHRSSGAHGPEGFRQVIEQFFEGFPDMKVTVEHILGEGDLVATRGYWTGTHKGAFMGIPASGKQVKVEYADVWKIKDGRAIDNWVQMDMVGLMSQVGAQPAPQSEPMAA